MKSLRLDPDLTVMYEGKGKSAGPLPALFYFALSAEDSLNTQPYNQPVQFLHGARLRIFSLTLPFHENNFPPKEAFARWAEVLATHEDFLSPFLVRAERVVTLLIEQGWILPEKLAVAGLSRGAFIACHLAARCKAFQTIIGFAPLVRLGATKDFAALSDQPHVQAFDLHQLAPLLYDRKIRFYIGNCDQRVGTEHAFTFIEAVAKCALQHRIRSSPIELIIGPSYGFQGHGTLPKRFQSGVDYLKGELL
ncbi:MAG: hypothetical protein AAF443_05345 [Chlamydiota bacterium]